MAAFGANHAHVGAYLLRLWGLPESVAGAIELHHSIGSAEILGFCPLLSLHLSQELSPGRESRIDSVLLARLGLEERVADWRFVLNDASHSSSAPVHN